VSSTLVIIIVTSVISLIAMGRPGVLDALIMWPPVVREKNEYYRLATYGLVHGSIGHLFFNMLTLYFFGRVMESFYDSALGNYGFVFFYVLGLIVSILPTYLKHRDDPNYRSLGASGAVCGVLFGFILIEPWSSMYIIPIPVPIPAIVFAVMYVAYSIYANSRDPDPTVKTRIGHSAHLWGAAYGVIFTIALEPQVLPHFLQALANPHF
jgi:membrane associated rhomboid family serine protease